MTLLNSWIQCRTLIAEMNRISAEHDRGDIDVSIPAEKFEGDYRKMAQGINGMVRAISR